MHPIGVESYVGYADETAEGLVEGFAFYDFFYGCASGLTVRSGRAEVGVEGGLPHGDEEDHVALLAGVLLCDLEFDGLAGYQTEDSLFTGLNVYNNQVAGLSFDLDFANNQVNNCFIKNNGSGPVVGTFQGLAGEKARKPGSALDGEGTSVAASAIAARKTAAASR